jgi:hypothetical protein
MFDTEYLEVFVLDLSKLYRKEEIWFNGTSTQKGHIVPVTAVQHLC